MAKRKKKQIAILVPFDLKSKNLRRAAKWLRGVHVYEFCEEELVWEAEELKEFYDDVIIVMKSSK